MKILDVPQSGKSGRTVTYKHRTGQYRRKYVRPRDPSTPAQLARRDAFQQAATLWATLTQKQYRLWETAAEDCRTKKQLNRAAKLQTYHLFCPPVPRRRVTMVAPIGA